VVAIEGQAGNCDLDDKHRPRGMLAAVVAASAGRHRDVRLELGLLVESDRPCDRISQPGPKAALSASSTSPTAA
jgi:hypothetical protein